MHSSWRTQLLTFWLKAQFAIDIGCRAIAFDVDVLVRMDGNKRRRISPDQVNAIRRVLHTGGITMTGLADLLRRLRNEGLPDATMHGLRESNFDDFRRISLVFQMPLSKGGSWAWNLIDPVKLLQCAVDRSPMLQGLFSAAIRRSRPTLACPWRLVIGFDEFVPGIV